METPTSKRLDSYPLSSTDRHLFNYLLGRIKQNYIGSCYIKRFDEFTLRFCSVGKLKELGIIQVIKVEKNVITFQIVSEYRHCEKFKFLSFRKKK